jgi:kynureninase
VHYNFLAAQRAGFKPVLVKSPDGIRIPTERFVEAIDEHTLAVVIDQSIFRSGYLQDVRELTRAAHRVGAMAIVDSYQATGTVPVDVQEFDCDFLVGGSVKWLCGGPGASYMYVKKKLIKKLEPTVTGWFSQKHPFNFDMSALDPRDDGWRFIGGTPSVISLYQATPGIEIIRRIGVKAIRKKSIAMTSYLIEELRKLPVEINSPLSSAERGGIVCVNFDGAQNLERRLVSNRIFVDYRPMSGIRISPHFYTEPRELDRILLEIKRVVK